MTQIERLSAWHKAQIGTRESGVNNVRYNTLYYGREVSGNSFEWCAAYIWAGFRECGLDAAFLGGGKSAYCPYIMDWAKQHGRWVTDGYREGDLLLYDWGADGVADHIGYCLSWDGVNAIAIEGNAADQVMEVRRSRGQIMGAYRPDYGEEDDGSVAAGAFGTENGAVLPELSIGARGPFVQIMQRRLIALYYGLPRYGADGELGEETEYALRAFQRDLGLEADGVCGGQSWSALLDGR